MASINNVGSSAFGVNFCFLGFALFVCCCFFQSTIPGGIGGTATDIGYCEEVIEKVSKNELNNLTWWEKQKQQIGLSTL